MNVPEVFEGLDELVVLESLVENDCGSAGVRAFLAWDPRLEREVQLWLLEREPTADRAERIRRWGAHDSPGLVPLHGRGELPTGECFLTFAQQRGTPLRRHLEATPSSERRGRVLAALARTLARLEREALAWPELTAHVLVDEGDRPVLEAVLLDRDAVPGDGLRAMRALAACVPLGAALASAIASADDLDALAQALEPGPPPTRVGVRIALIALVSLSVGLAASWWWGRELRPFPDGVCELAERRASAWVDQGPALEGPARAGIRRRADRWARVAGETCVAVHQERLSASLAQARGRCLEEQLTALGGVRAALFEHPGASEAAVEASLAIAGPDDACAWGPEEGYLLRPRAARPVHAELVARVAELRARAILGEASTFPGPDPELVGALPPRWAAQLADLETRRATDDAVWRRASWDRFTLSVEAGDDLSALDALMDRAAAGRGPPVVTETSRRLATAWIQRLPSHLGNSPRIQGWLEPRRRRLTELGSEAD